MRTALLALFCLAAFAEEHLPAVKLRGYGTVSASYRDAGENGSVLKVTCESVEKARLLHAKYLSDLGLLPGATSVELSTNRGTIPAIQIADQGFVAAIGLGREVHLLSARSAATLKQLVPAAGELRLRPNMRVPMFLDRWDRHGFLYYYRAWERPKDQSSREPYDYGRDFEFARANGGKGFAFWSQEAQADNAEGMMEYPYWDFALEQARALNLPAHINISASPASWLANRFREQTMLKMPQYEGHFYTPGDPSLGGMGILSRNSGQGLDAELGLLQSAVRRFASYPNVVGWLQPFGEMFHGFQDLLLEYGPVADASYRQYLQQRYGSVSAVSRRWHGNAERLRDWSAVKVPELAEFLGWGPSAIDLRGEWRVSHETEGEWFSVNFNDQKWGSIVAPGNDRTLFLPKQPAVFRRTFDVTQAWRSAHKRVWIYVWDFNRAYPDKLVVYLNGRVLGESPIERTKLHWASFEVSDVLRAGSNQVTLRLPKGFLGYRIYLSPEPPRQYPDLGPHKNAQWVDFMDWYAWTRGEEVRRGTEMIRQVDPDRQITFMHPDEFAGMVKPVAEKYGAVFHNTGYMAGSWADINPLICNSSGLPSSAEPGSGAVDGPDFLRFMGRWLTEGVQGITYFIHIGEILWKDDVRKLFLENLKMYEMVGKYHRPEPEVAILYSDRNWRLTQWPWRPDPNLNLYTGYREWNPGYLLLPLVPRDGLTEEDFAAGNADKYRVIFDSNTAIMDTPLLGNIEKWVRAGGTFVTFAQTGRHTSTQPDAWPISRLSGYKVTHIDAYGSNGEPSQWRKLRAAPGQNIFAVQEMRGSGLSLRKTAPECRDLLVWEDGSVAAGMRPLGNGFVIQIGPRFGRLGDRGLSPETTALFSQILNWRGVKRVPARAEGVMLRHYLSNNGLYDVWTLWNERDKPITTDLVFGPGVTPAKCLEVKTGSEVAIARDRIAGIQFTPFETRMYLTPRGQVKSAALDWFRLQRQWWRGAAAPDAKPLPTAKSLQTHTVDLSEDWEFRPLDGKAGTERRRLSIWSAPVKHGILKRTFRVPIDWTDGRVTFSVRCWAGSTFNDRGRISLDGAPVRDFSAEGLLNDPMNGALKPGSTHTIELEVSGSGSLVGVKGNAWLSYLPNPQRRIDLAGEWIPSKDYLHDDAPVRLPGPWSAAVAKRTIRIDKAYAGLNAVVHIEGEGPLIGVIANGTFVRRHHHVMGGETNLNITPWLRYDADNVIEVVRWGGAGPARLQKVELNFYRKGVYP